MRSEIVELAARRRTVKLLTALNTHELRTHAPAATIHIEADGDRVATLEMPLHGSADVELPAWARSLTLRDEDDNVRASLLRDEWHADDGRCDVDDGRIALAFDGNRLSVETVDVVRASDLADELHVPEASDQRPVKQRQWWPLIAAAVVALSVGAKLSYDARQAPRSDQLLADPARVESAAPRIEAQHSPITELVERAKQLLDDQLRRLKEEAERDMVKPEGSSHPKEKPKTIKQPGGTFKAPPGKCDPGDPLCTDL